MAKKAYPQCPPRLPELYHCVDPFYFLTFNTHARKRTLATPAVHDDFCQRAAARNVAVGRYVLMPDHVHLFVMLSREGLSIGRWEGSLRMALGKVLSAAGHARPHWQRNFFEHVVRSSESYERQWSYVRQNPVRAGLCRVPEEWRFQGDHEDGVSMRFWGSQVCSGDAGS